MFIRSDTLTAADIRAALQHAWTAGYDIHLDDDGIREFSARRYRRGFQFYCEALAGPRARNGRPGKAASWDAYGVAMAYLYKLDPQAEIAWYKGAADFIEKTETTAMSYNPRKRGFEAPWLADAELRNVA